MTREYNLPSTVRWSALLETSKSKGLPTEMAAFSGQFTPSSPTYYQKRQPSIKSPEEPCLHWS